jgi:cysteine desulfurase/selenocysteine lyase
MSIAGATVQQTREDAARPFDVARVRADFPILARRVHGKPLVYLDNAASTQKPRAVIETLARFYQNDYANVHRGVHELSQVATNAYEGAREKVRGFLNAGSIQEVVFTRGTTESINLVAASFGRARVGPGDEIVLSAMEHHSNIVPWQLLCEEKGARLRVIPMSDSGVLRVDELAKMLGERTKLVTVLHVSNALGTVTPVKHIIELAHARGIPVLIDGAQAVAHMSVDVRDLQCDFYAFSGHKIFGPTGVGVLYGRRQLLEAMPPYEGGGDMIRSVTFEKTTWNDLPYKFEAGTPNIAGVIGLGAALDYVSRIGLDAINAYEQGLLAYATNQLKKVPGLTIIGTATCKASVISFKLEGIHPHDIGTVLDREGVAIRTGHHCAQPVMDFFGVPATARASLALYNTRAEIDALVAALGKAIEVFR